MPHPRTPLDNRVRVVTQFLDNNLSIADATNTFIPWDGFGRNTGGFDVSQPTEIIIPPGIENVILRAQVIFDQNVTGTRIATFFKNGSRSFEGACRDIEPGLALDNTHLHLFTAPIAVERGDSFQIQVFQDSTLPLDLDGSPSGRDTWFSIQSLDL